MLTFCFIFSMLAFFDECNWISSPPVMSMSVMYVIVHVLMPTICDIKCPCNSFFEFKRWGGRSPTGSTRHVGHQLAYCIWPGWLWGWRIWWNDGWQGKLKYSEKSCPSDTLSTTNLTWPDQARTQAATVGSQELTTWATARRRCLLEKVSSNHYKILSSLSDIFVMFIITLCWDTFLSWIFTLLSFTGIVAVNFLFLWICNKKLTPLYCLLF
jgi:hypothetical protein